VPNSASAAKRVRQSAKRRTLNNWRIRRIKSQVKSFLSAVQDGNASTAEAEYRKACAVLDRIACTGTIHRNAAARRKSRLARKLNAIRGRSG
jgi:small subunit ribosomal protein S20